MEDPDVEKRKELASSKPQGRMKPPEQVLDPGFLFEGQVSCSLSGLYVST